MFATRFYVIAGLLACIGLASMVLNAPAPADPVRPPKEWDLTGYPATVCSVFVNNTNAAGTASYTVVEMPTGMTCGRVIISPIVPNAAQTFTMRFWASTTDSSGAYMTLSYPSAATKALDTTLNIKCKKISFTGMEDTHDYVICAYCYFQ